jgi:type IV pilus assembly protein PilB
MEVDATVERMTVSGASLEEITQYAISNGMAPLRQDGWWKVSQGLTSIDEILRVVV